MIPSAQALGRRTSSGSAPHPGGSPSLIRELDMLRIPPEQALPPRLHSTGSDGRLQISDTDTVLDFSNVVKVLSTVQKPDYENPWQTLGVEKGIGSGVAFFDGESRRILTAAHVVAHHTFVQVQRTAVETPDKYIATVAAICHECDLALLEVEDSTFWQDLHPARLIDVLVAGFPIGGGELSITEGVVSRIEGQSYTHTRRPLLAISVDAAMNPGNSGGPVFNIQGDLVGVAFQQLKFASNVGYIIPQPVIQHFLSGVATWGPDGYRGFPGMGFEMQDLALENPYLRKHLDLEDSVRGVLVTKVLFGQTCDGILEPYDVVTHVAGQPVANNGTVPYGKYGRVEIAIIFSLQQVESPIELRIVRNGQQMILTVTAKPYQRLVPLQFDSRHPPFFVYCGLVFQQLSLDYINFQGGENPVYVSLFFTGRQKSNWKRAIVLTQVLSDKVNLGYEGLLCEKILKVNGEEVVDLADLVRKIESTAEPILKLESCCDDVILLPSPINPDSREANERIRKHYSLGSDRYLEDRN